AWPGRFCGTWTGQTHHRGTEDTEVHKGKTEKGRFSVVSSLCESLCPLCLCGELTTQIPPRNFRTRHVAQLGDLAHLVDVDAEVRAGADQAVGVSRREAVVGDEPVHQV